MTMSIIRRRYIRSLPARAGKRSSSTSVCGKNGIPEGEQAISTFSVKSYRHANADLRKAYGKDYASYVAHYMKKGFAENRTTTGWDDKFKDPVTSYNNKSYSRVYDFYFYIGKYASVRKKYADDDIGALQYFVKKGIKKKHQASEDFNVVWYYNANPTLRGTCGQTWSRYYEYYQRKGYKKGKVTGLISTGRSRMTPGRSSIS